MDTEWDHEIERKYRGALNSAQHHRLEKGTKVNNLIAEFFCKLANSVEHIICIDYISRPLIRNKIHEKKIDYLFLLDGRQNESWKLGRGRAALQGKLQGVGHKTSNRRCWVCEELSSFNPNPEPHQLCARYLHYRGLGEWEHSCWDEVRAFHNFKNI